MSAVVKFLYENSPLFGGNAAFIEELYETYLEDPQAVSEQWRSYFRELQISAGSERLDVSHVPIQQAFAHRAQSKREVICSPLGADQEAIAKQSAVTRLIEAYRARGHQHAKLDPLELTEIVPVPDLEPSYHQLTALDMQTEFSCSEMYCAEDRMSLKDILSMLQTIYCGSIGSEYEYITETAQKKWIRQRLERPLGRPNYDAEQKQHLLKMVTAAEGIERYLHRKYVGQKRFSLEGGEALIPMLDDIIQRSGSNGCKEIVLGMAHRGRLNVLVNTLGKSPELLFKEFEGLAKKETMSGDVKYHMGFSSDIQTPGGSVHVALAFNPSHLEIINPVVEGSVRARQQRRGDVNGRSVIPVLIHGDSAFAGQGVVSETLNMAKTRGFRTGGTLHIVINNQIGFTTSNPIDIRSTTYCTDVAKLVQAPIFHVNGDDPEAVMFVTQMAFDFCVEFKMDVVIDMVCYRRHGHNEADEPAATQPVMYSVIRKRATTRELYAKQLVSEGVMSAEQAQQMVEDYQQGLDEGRVDLRQVNDESHGMVDWSPYIDQTWKAPCDTRVTAQQIRDISDAMQQLPEGWKLHSRVSKIVADRKKMGAAAMPIDWGFAEALAFATLVTEGIPVRLCGQDAGRGTFSHRHSVLHNQIDGASHIPLQNLSEDQEQFLVIDSLLSEEAVLGFEYGYTTTDPDTLVMWEAQFGDFANGAQVVIDQFISSGVAKWGRLCGLVMLLPHGYEGQGPEHSSARLERFMQLCAHQNIQVCVPTTPAQCFHMLRRQAIRPFRQPLIVMTPKSLLRHKLAVSTIEDLTDGKFQLLIGEIDPVVKKEVDRVVLCCGKVYYDLLAYRRDNELKNMVIIRIEQLYPFPDTELSKQLKSFPNLKQVIWCQEEPQNQGSWHHIRHRIERNLPAGTALAYAGRTASASTAVGHFSDHVRQQEQLVIDAFS